MAGRTHLQQALPVTFGYKTAIWLAMFDRHAERLAQLKPRVLVGQFAGAAGTLASLGDKGFEVQQALCEELGLGVPVSTWHVARDGLAEVVNFFGLVTGSLGKIALDIMIMASTEFAELYEPFVKGRGASSTMPQKRNPISSELMLAACKGVRQHAGLMLDAMVQDFKRILALARTTGGLHPGEPHAFAVRQPGRDKASLEAGFALRHLFLRAAQRLPPGSAMSCTRQCRIEDLLDLIEAQHEFRRLLLLQIVAQRVIMGHSGSHGQAPFAEQIRQRQAPF